MPEFLGTLAIVALIWAYIAFIRMIRSSDNQPIEKEKTDGNDWRTDQGIHRDPDPPAPSGAGGPTITVTLDSGAGGKGEAEGAGIVLGETIAYRRWDVVGGYLTSMCGCVWIPGQPLTSTDFNISDGMGIHAFKNIEDVRTYNPSERSIVGAVALWGRVIEHEDGFRAEFAKPLSFLESDIPADELAVIAERYEAEHDYT